MKLVCINNEDIVEIAFADPFYQIKKCHLTLNKIYEGEIFYKGNDLVYSIHNDIGENDIYDSVYFEPLSDIRKQKLKKLL